MNDIEYISELAVGFLHGLQNKKESLDKWYQAYEEEFPARKRMERAFRSTLGEITSVLPEIGKTRWRKKSDFYSLFLLLAENAKLFPLAKDQRQELGDILLSFGKNVDEYLSDPQRFNLATRNVKITRLRSSAPLLIWRVVALDAPLS
ncbi:hypothetical protein LZK73_15285 [Neorhizobium galegae]|nr:hypothetical protein LZK73_15285 [Neorhizobium galegae]